MIEGRWCCIQLRVFSRFRGKNLAFKIGRDTLLGVGRRRAGSLKSCKGVDGRNGSGFRVRSSLRVPHSALRVPVRSTWFLHLVPLGGNFLNAAFGVLSSGFRGKRNASKPKSAFLQSPVIVRFAQVNSRCLRSAQINSTDNRFRVRSSGLRNRQCGSGLKVE
jgi:hypothetical protein